MEQNLLILYTLYCKFFCSSFLYYYFIYCSFSNSIVSKALNEHLNTCTIIVVSCIFHRFSLQFVVISDVSACLVAKQGNGNRKQEVKMIISQIWKKSTNQNAKEKKILNLHFKNMKKIFWIFLQIIIIKTIDRLYQRHLRNSEINWGKLENHKLMWNVVAGQRQQQQQRRRQQQQQRQ